MTDDDKHAFSSIMVGLAENYSQTVTPDGMRLRFEALKMFGIDEVKQAAMSLLASRKFTSMPTVADFLEHIGGGNAEDKAEIEAGKVVEAVRSVGAYRSVVFDDPVTMAVISRAFGGWVKLCQNMTDREEKFFRKEFKQAYGSYSRQGIREGGSLLGLSESQNLGRGLGHSEAPKLIGDSAKAEQVLAMPDGSLTIGTSIPRPQIRRLACAEA
jgi:hypothetical protein